MKTRTSFTARLSQALVSKGLMSRQQVDRLLEEAKAHGTHVARLLIDQGLVTEQALVGLLAEELGIPMLSLSKYRLDPEVAKLVPERIARQYALIPLSKLGQRLVVAMADPLNVFALDDLKTLTHYAVDPVLAEEVEIRRAIEKMYGASSALGMAASAENGEAGAAVDTAAVESAIALQVGGEADEAPIVKAINQLIVEAIRKRASDIHLEPIATGLRVRYRIDGRLMEAHRMPKKVQSAVLTRLKILSGLDITEWRLPQDGRFKVRLDTREVDFRVSMLPITHGGKVVLRVLDQSNLSIGLDHLGFLPESLEAFKQAVTRPHGMILVTGPTGSGKSTTLYSILNQLNTSIRNITTIEDPVEYQLEGITQVQVNPDIGLTFAGGLRALLRQSPDVVMIGEIRDFETADIAMKASLTGQLVLSTLHTNDASSAVTRLVDMGVEPFLVASSVTLIEAQRLVRKLCTNCRVPSEPPAQALQRWTRRPDGPPSFYQAAGCHLCNRTGYHGRMGVLETLVIDEHLRELIVANAQSWEIKDYAVKTLGMTTLHEDGLKKAAMGLTSVEEVLAVTSEE